MPDASSTTRVCPECGCDPALAKARPPFWGRPSGLATWLSVGMVAFIVFMAGMTALHTPPTRAYGQTYELLGMTAGEVRAAANGDAQLQERLAARLCEVADAPWMTGQAQLSLSSTALAGSHTDNLEL